MSGDGDTGIGLSSHTHVPDGYAAVPFTAAAADGPVRLCLVVRWRPDPVGGRLVVVRDGLGSRAYLGCVCDAAGGVREWVEFDVQQPPDADHPLMHLHVGREAVTNAALEVRWKARLAHAAEAGGAGGVVPTLLRTGWEAAAPCATFVDPAAMAPVHPAGESGRLLVLCRDDALLAGAGLPTYAASMHRYLYDAGDPGARLVPVTPGAPVNGQTRGLAEVLPNDGELLPVNPTAAAVAVRSFAAASLADVVRQLGGAPPAGVRHGLSTLPIGPASAAPVGAGAGDGDGGLGAWVFPGGRGRAGRFVEAFHLKVRLLLNLVGQVRAFAARTDRPLLNLRPDSFAVFGGGGASGGDPATGLPALWTCRPVLVDPGDAIAVELPAGAGGTAFLPPGRSGLSIYQPPQVALRYAGRGQFQIRKTFAELDADAPPDAEVTPETPVVFEATFHTPEPLLAGERDVVWFRLNVPRPLDLFARPDQRGRLGAGELRFRTVPRPFDPATLAALRAAEGVPLPNVAFEVIPRLGVAADLYSLAVMAVELLLVRDGDSLPETVSNVAALARHAGRSGTGSLADRLVEAFADEPQFADLLGPHRLVSDPPITPAAARAAVPDELWFDALAAVVGMFPGLSAGGVAVDVGDTPAAGPAATFDPAIAALRSLVVRSRSLLAVDWQYNREVHATVAAMRKQRGESAAV